MFLGLEKFYAVPLAKISPFLVIFHATAQLLNGKTNDIFFVELCCENDQELGFENMIRLSKCLRISFHKPGEVPCTVRRYIATW
jgi:hypothetical protein